MVTEQTQFSMSELNEFLKNDCAPAASSLNKREKAMVAFSRTAASELDFSTVGNVGNVQRVRVLADPGTPEDRHYEFVAKLPVGMLAEKEAKAKKEAAIVEFKRLVAVDPKAAEEYLKKEAYKVLDRMVTLFLLESFKAVKKTSAKPRQAKEPALKKPVGKYAIRGAKAKVAQKQDAYALALEQDRLNRIKASKDAALARKKAS